MDEILNRSIRQLRERVVGRKYTARELCQIFLHRAQQNAGLGIMTDLIAQRALADADTVDRRVAAGKDAGRLAGIPMVIKDNIDTVPAVCAAGLPALSPYRPPTDAAVVRRLRAEGAVIIGVAATDSGAFGVTSPTVTKPKFPGLIAGGPSGGSAAAVAAGFCMAAIDTDTGGSIRIPAACCGIVGLKPTYGLLPFTGVRPLSPAADHVGPLARCVDDLRIVIQVFCPTNSDAALQLLKRQRIGIPSTYFTDANAAFRQ